MKPARARGRSAIPQCRSAEWVAERLGGVSVQWIHQLHKAGRLRGILLRGVKDGPGTGRLVFPEDAVLAYMRAPGKPTGATQDES
ncbi:MAG TPA: hypothetical protein VFQ07_08775 [Candidatus Polarisedimenticolia bacterium]|nr:hypothetical protein [Candidatus Polarisedimenticolia bacterium]